jgi:3'-5' exoribonuclease
VSRPKPAVTRLSELQPGQFADFFALLAEKNRGATREGKPFYACRFRDARRTVAFMAWEDGDYFERCELDWRPGMFFKVRARYTEHPQFGPQIDVSAVRPVTDADRADGFSEADFVARSRFDPAAMLAELRGLAESAVESEPLRRLVLGLLDRHARRLLVLPATRRHFYPFPGGWLEHTLSVTKKCLWLVEQYRDHYPDLRPPLNRDVVVAGTVLHDLGRAVALEPGGGPAEPPELTVPGQLLGHLFLGRDLVRDAAREQGDVPPELLALVEHMLVAHLNHPEWGSPRLPLIPEVLILHHADDLDAKMEMFARRLRQDASAGPFTERDPVLGRQLFKGREV